MEFCSNGEVDEFIRRKRDDGDPVSMKRKIEMLEEIAQGVRYLHSKEIIHRDLKPSNVMLDESFHCKLLDFGISRMLENTSRSVMTVRIGTPLFMAPEVVLGHHGFEVDVYSFSILLYEILTENFHPFGIAAEANGGLEFRVANDPSCRPDLNVLQCGSILKNLLQRMWHADPNQRPSFTEITKHYSITHPIGFLPDVRVMSLTDLSVELQLNSEIDSETPHADLPQACEFSQEDRSGENGWTRFSVPSQKARRCLDDREGCCCHCVFDFLGCLGFDLFGESCEPEGPNTLRTTRYGLLSFIPLSLFLEFRRFSNIYFVVVLLISLIPGISPIEPGTFAIPPIMVLSFGMIRELIQDLARRRIDNRENRRFAHLIDLSEARLEKTKAAVRRRVRFAELEVGDILLLREGDVVPADLAVLYSSDSVGGRLFITTATLDGETGLQRRDAVFSIDADEGITETEVIEKRVWESLEFQVSPNSKRLDAFEGYLTVVPRKESQDLLRPLEGLGPLERVISLSINNFLPRGGILRSPTWCIGVVVYCGRKTKISLNFDRQRAKMSRFDTGVTYYIIALLLGQQILAALLTVGFYLFRFFVGRSHWYLTNLLQHESGEFVFLVRNILSFEVLISYIVPVNLFMELRFSKYRQAKFMERNFRDHGQRLTVRSFELNQDLATIDICFADKTGTLTKNQMSFAAAFVSGVGVIPKSEEFPLLATLRSHQLSLFLVAACVNNSLSVSLNSDLLGGDSYSYHGTSVDERVLVTHLSEHSEGIMVGRKRSRVAISLSGELVNYDSVETIPFSPIRKRMTVIVQSDKLEDEVLIFVKGADTVVLPLICRSDEVDGISECVSHLEKFTKQGLRTLVFAYKQIRRSVMASILDDLSAARRLASDDPESSRTQIEALYGQIESDLQILGVAAIEDELQEGVVETVEYLTSAGIGVWCLTGDNPETAQTVCRSAGILREERCLRVTRETYDGPTELADPFVAEIDLPFDVLMDGAFFRDAVKNGLEEKLILLMRNCSALVCSRVSPSQKAAIVGLVQQKLRLRGLAVGDGGNDVSMIHKASIGVGLEGSEGCHASLAADFALSEFSELVDLVAVEGRYQYIRNSEVFMISLRKTAVIVLVSVFHSVFNGVSALIMFDDNLLMAFKLFAHQAVPFFAAILARDYDRSTIRANPKLYREMRSRNPYFGVTRVCFYLIIAVLQASLIFFLTMLNLSGMSGVAGDWLDTGDIAYTGYVLLTICTLVEWSTNLLTRKTLNFSVISGVVGSFFCYVFCAVVLAQFSCFLDVCSFHKISTNVSDRVSFYLHVIFVVTLSTLPLLLLKYVSDAVRVFIVL